MSDDTKISKPNRRRMQDTSGKKRKPMPQHGRELKRTLQRHIDHPRKTRK